MSLQQAARNASPIAIQEAGRRLKNGRLPFNRWLALRNHYAKDPVKSIATDQQAHTQPKSRPMAEYLAASIPLHCFDGWSFLSNAVASLLDGDELKAIHMAYYAELRAAMSFLASQGIGIFNRQHCWFDEKKKCKIENSYGTHQAVWQALTAWSNDPNRSITLLNLFTVRGTTFLNWLTAAGYAPGPTLGLLAQDWLANWSLDLKVLANDHLLRNEVSYRPEAIAALSSQANLREICTSVFSYWRACEPTSVGQFGTLDLYLLRQAIRSAYKATNGSNTTGSGYRHVIEGALNNLGIRDTALSDFLMVRTSPIDLPLLLNAKQTRRQSRTKTEALPIIARALLLLRIASASTFSFLDASGLSGDQLEFWWKQIGVELGFWIPGAEPGTMTDLWADIQSAIDALEALFDAPNGGAPVFALDARQGNALDLWLLKQFQRAGLWAFVS